MQISDYFKNLSKTRSGNFLAMLGFLIFSYTFVGAISRLVQGIFSNKIWLIKDIPATLIGETFYYISFFCLFSLIPTIVLFVFLYKPIFKLRTQSVILISVFLYLIKSNFVAIDYSTGAGIFFAFALIAFPLAIIYILIFFILLCCDFRKAPKFKNQELINNKYYELFVLIFYLYALILPNALGCYFIPQLLF